AAAELLVEGLAADTGGAGDRGHRDLRPGAALQLVAGGAEERLAQQLARSLRVGSASDGHRGNRLSGSGHSPSPPSSGSKSTLSRTPQSGQAHSSGTSLHAVP